MKLSFLALVVLSASWNIANAGEVPDAPHIVVVGRGSVSTTPDMAVVSLDVSSRMESSLDAKADIDARVNRFLAFLEGVGVSLDDVVASSLLTEPLYEWQDDKEVFLGFMATRSLEVTLRDPAKLNEVMDGTLEAGIEHIKHVKMTSSRAAELQDIARKAAIEDSKEVAAQMAADYGAKLGRIYRVNFGGYNREGRVEVTGSRIRRSDLAPGTYLSHTISFSEQVTAVFYLEASRRP